MARSGKIACLPHPIRAQINTRLDNGAYGRDILARPHSWPEVKLLLDSRFKGRLVTKQNLSRWRQGGYEIWLLQQDILVLATKAAKSSQSGSPITINQAKSR